MNKNKPTHCLSRALAIALALGFSASLVRADGPATATPAASTDTTVELQPFKVTGEQVGPYNATDAASGGRVRVSLFDSTQNISVVTRDMFDDVAATRLLDALKYSTGITESTIPNGQDRMTIRGFQAIGSVMDNFSGNIQENTDPVLIDRVELVKGPSAVLAPAGVPGGTVNIVSRKPEFDGNSGYISAIAGVYDANRIEFDDNQIVNDAKSVAFRVVGSATDARGYVGETKHSYALMPMLSLRTDSGTLLTLQVQYTDAHFENYFGLPLDPSSGTNTTAKLLSGVDRFANTYQADYRSERKPVYKLFLTVPLAHNVSMRLAAHFEDYNVAVLQNLPSTPSATFGGATDPFTGDYTPGTIYGPKPTFTAMAAPAMPRILNRSGSIESDHFQNGDLQNDYVWNYRSKLVSLTTLTGFWMNYSRIDSLVWGTTASPINYDAITPETYTAGPLVASYDNINYQEQAYLSQNVGLLDDRLILNGSYAYNHYDLHSDDYRYPGSWNYTLHSGMRSLGAVAKPLPWLDAYYTYSENATPSNAESIGSYGAKTFQSGVQNEVGLRLDAWNHRLYATVDYFHITQNNYAIANPGNYVIPAPVPPLQPLYFDRIAKGWELELHWVVNDQLSLVGSGSTFTNRDPHNVGFRGTAEKSAALLMNYRFAKHTALEALALTLGVDYLGKRPGDAVSGVTGASTSTNIIPVQPTFYLPSRTLVNVGAKYLINKNWKVQLNIDNLFDQKYLEASINRFTVYPGAPINARGTFTYIF